MWTRHQWSGRKTRPRATDRLESKSDGRFRGRRRPPVAVCRRPEHAVRPRVARARNRLERRPRRSTQRLRRRARLTARGETPAAFGRRCIPAGCVAPRSNTPGILARRALPSGRIAALGATLDFHHGLLADAGASKNQELSLATTTLTKTTKTVCTLSLSALCSLWFALAVPGAAAAQNVQTDPIQCWWRTSAGAIRAGEPFSLVLTCAVVENDAAKVVVDQSKLEPAVVQFAPFEVIPSASSHGADLRSGERRF